MLVQKFEYIDIRAVPYEKLLTFFDFGLLETIYTKANLLPPTVEFTSTAITGKQTTKVSLEGQPLFGKKGLMQLAQAEVAYSFEASLPTFDAATGKLSEIKIGSFMLGEPIVTGGKKTSNVIELLGIALSELAGILEQDLIPTVQSAIDVALNDLPALTIPPIPNFPLNGMTTTLSLENALIQGVPESVRSAQRGNQSH